MSVYLEVLKVYDDRLKVQTFRSPAGTTEKYAAHEVKKGNYIASMRRALRA